MTLTKFTGQYEELFDKCVLWWPGYDTTTFPIIPSGVTATPIGTFSNDLTIPNGKKVKTFTTSNHISLTTNATWNIYNSDFTIASWINVININATQYLYSQYNGLSNRARFWYHPSGILSLTIVNSGSIVANYNAPFLPSENIWTYIVLQRSGSNCLMYVDSIQKVVTTGTGWTTTADLGVSFDIGYYDGGGYLQGNIKDLMIWNGRALTQAEIKLLMIKTSPITGSDVYPIMPGRRGVE